MSSKATPADRRTPAQIAQGIIDHEYSSQKFGEFLADVYLQGKGGETPEGTKLLAFLQKVASEQELSQTDKTTFATDTLANIHAWRKSDEEVRDMFQALATPNMAFQTEIQKLAVEEEVLRRKAAGIMEPFTGFPEHQEDAYRHGGFVANLFAIEAEAQKLATALGIQLTTPGRKK